MICKVNVRLAGLALAACLCWWTTSAQAVVVWDESVDGDISGNRLAPSSAALVRGSNTLTATSMGPSASADREYIHFSVPAPNVLRAIYLDAYASLDNVAFIGVQSGTTFTQPPTGTDVAQLLGYSHFGPDVPGATVGEDVLPDVGMGPGSIGFVPPLAAGDYTFWIQQTSANAATYTLDFVVTPEPGTLVISGIGAAMALVARRRRRAIG